MTARQAFRALFWLAAGSIPVAAYARGAKLEKEDHEDR